MNSKIAVTTHAADPSGDPALIRALQILEDDLYKQGAPFDDDHEEAGGAAAGNSKILGGDGDGDETNSTTVLNNVGAKNMIDDEGPCMQCSRPLIIILSCLAIAIIIPCLFIFDIITNSDLEGLPGLEDIDVDGFFDSDPFNGQVTPQTPEAAYRWPTEGISGLELSLLNALDDSWQPFYEKAMADWENGEPDTLTLSSSRVEIDPACDQVNGVMKVCNGDYGDTEWRGLNIVLLDFQRRWIYASSAKMNDFYLKTESRFQWQYTMCHELGHGFGLPHWDEDFFNRNLGNCLDYTDRPRSNAQPDRSNFEFLATLYGVIGGTAPPVQDNPTPPVQSNPTRPDDQGPLPGSGPGSNPYRGEDDDDRRRVEEGDSFLRGTGLEGVTPATRKTVPADVMNTLNGVVRELDIISSSPGGAQSWNVLRSEEHGEIREIDLGSGFVARAYMLRAI
jgi:hypothetical protein